MLAGKLESIQFQYMFKVIMQMRGNSIIEVQSIIWRNHCNITRAIINGTLFDPLTKI